MGLGKHSVQYLGLSMLIQHSVNVIFVDSTETYTQHAHSLGGGSSTTSTIPISRTSEEEKKVTVIKAPHYSGIGPVDESGIPTAIRTVGNAEGEGECVCVNAQAHTMN